MPSKTQSNSEANLHLEAEPLNTTKKENTENDDSISIEFFSERLEGSSEYYFYPPLSSIASSVVPSTNNEVLLLKTVNYMHSFIIELLIILHLIN